MAKIATRESYGQALAELGKEHDFLVFDADLSAATKTSIFKKAFPDRFINAGIAEANMISAAAGVAACGKPVFVSSFAMFAAGRGFEQIRNSVGYPGLNVKICATHAGLSVGEDGATHQCLEDIALMRSIPGMTVINPADDIEATQAVKAALLQDGPVYMRLGRMAVDDVNEPGYKFQIGKGEQLAEGENVTLLATGLMIGFALQARKELASCGISARVINIHTIKPFDQQIVIKAAQETGAVVTCEEHSIYGGLGSATAEVLCENYPVPLERVGVRDMFGKSGKPAQLFEAYSITPLDIAAAAKKAIARKGE